LAVHVLIFFPQAFFIEMPDAVSNQSIGQQTVVCHIH
jgi:hypothetical protein